VEGPETLKVVLKIKILLFFKINKKSLKNASALLYFQENSKKIYYISIEEGNNRGQLLDTMLNIDFKIPQAHRSVMCEKNNKVYLTGNFLKENSHIYIHKQIPGGFFHDRSP
jgi:hypothetical protein